MSGKLKETKNSMKKEVSVPVQGGDAIDPEIADILRNVPKETQARIIALISHRVAQYSGPLPEAGQVEIYNRCIPNGGDRLMKVVETQAEARKENERKLIESKIKLDKTGQMFGFIIGLTGMSLGTLAACMGYSVFGSIIAGSTVVSLVSAFVLGNIANR